MGCDIHGVVEVFDGEKWIGIRKPLTDAPEYRCTPKPLTKL